MTIINVKNVNSWVHLKSQWMYTECGLCDCQANTPVAGGGPGSRDRTLDVKSRKKCPKIFFFGLTKITVFFFHISSSYINWGNFFTPRQNFSVDMHGFQIFQSFSSPEDILDINLHILQGVQPKSN